VALRTSADSWRWDGVPILIRAGKCLAVTATDVSFHFRRPPHDVFGLGDAAAANALRIRINPNDVVTLGLVGKQPGKGWLPQSQELVFAEPPGSDMRPYDRLIGAALSGERWLFARQDTVEAAWNVVEPVLGDVVPAISYAKGTWGPREADRLVPAGETWHDPAG
jgi:glucose-6-phosphate 1-dehydrogenase